jgi:hypothetical protein
VDAAPRGNGLIPFRARSSSTRSNCSGPRRSDTADASCSAAHRSSTIAVFAAAPTRLVADSPNSATRMPDRSPSRCAPCAPRTFRAASTASRRSPGAPASRAEVKPAPRSTPAPAATSVPSLVSTVSCLIASRTVSGSAPAGPMATGEPGVRAPARSSTAVARPPGTGNQQRNPGPVVTPNARRTDIDSMVPYQRHPIHGSRRILRDCQTNGVHGTPAVSSTLAAATATPGQTARVKLPMNSCAPGCSGVVRRTGRRARRGAKVGIVPAERELERGRCA